MMTALRSAAAALETLVFPRFCALCDAHAERPGVCERCRSRILERATPSCRRCARPVRQEQMETNPHSCPKCRNGVALYDSAIALAAYEDELRALCLKIKSRTRAWLAETLADMLLDGRRDSADAWLRAGQGAATLVVPVPLHWSRRLERGYNQAEAIAQVLGRRLGLRVCHPLRRVKRTRKLASLSRDEREKELRKAFGARAGAGRMLAGCDVILVDDILTTGTTCSMAARVLKRHGAGRVLALVIARAGDQPR